MKEEKEGQKEIVSKGPKKYTLKCLSITGKGTRIIEKYVSDEKRILTVVNEDALVESTIPEMLKNGSIEVASEKAIKEFEKHNEDAKPKIPEKKNESLINKIFKK